MLCPHEGDLPDAKCSLGLCDHCGEDQLLFCRKELESEDTITFKKFEDDRVVSVAAVQNLMGALAQAIQTLYDEHKQANPLLRSRGERGDGCLSAHLQ